jgi:hypothetical protein
MPLIVRRWVHSKKTFGMNASGQRSIAEEDRLSLKIACRQLKMVYDRAERLGALDPEERPKMERDLEKCAQDFPSLGIVSSVPTFTPAPTPATPSAYTRGSAALDKGDFDAAIAEFTAAIADNPKDTFSYIRRGTALRRRAIPHRRLSQRPEAC